jgi:hypothetical protein
MVLNMKRAIFTLLATMISFMVFGQAVPGCGTFVASGAITATSNTTISGKIIDLGGAATVGINIPANVHDVHITKCIIKNSTALSGLIRVNSGCYNITIDTCFFEAGWRGINVTNATNNIHIWYNYFYNINDPNVTASSSDGGGSSVQLNNCNGTSIQVLDNKSYHSISSGGIGDQFSVYQCNGTAVSPIRVCRNQAYNGSTNPPATGYVGAVGGDVGGSYQRIDSNTFVNVGSVLCQIQGGHDIEMSYNTGFLAQSSITSVGMAFGNYSGQPSTNITMAHNNVRCIQASGNVFNYWFDPNNAFAPNGWATNTTSTSLNASILPNPLWPSCTALPPHPVIAYSPTSYVFNVGTPIGSLVPTNTGGNVDTWTTTTLLPLGLGIDQNTGIISGTPQLITPSNTYIVNAVNAGGNSTEPLTIVINAALIVKPNISYSPTSYVYQVGTGITNINPSNSGGVVASWSISPTLSAGLSFNTGSGVISGTPTATRGVTSYTITATNTSGSSNAGVTITVNPAPVLAPNINISPSSFTFAVNHGIAAIIPTNSGGFATSWSISPALSAGLSFNTSTGVISGVPTTVQSVTTYTVTATNSTGVSHKNINITVNVASRGHWVYWHGKWVYRQ